MRFPEWVTRPFEVHRGQATSKVSLWRSSLGVFILFGIAFTLAITFAHLFVDISMSLLPPVSLWAEESLETAATLILLLPPFYLLVLQPLGRYIADRAKAEEALRNSEERYRSLVDTTTVGVFETSSDGTILYANEALATILEFDSAQQMLQAQAPNFYKEPSRREELLRILQRDGKVSAFEIAVLTSRGNERQVLLSAALDGDSLRGMLVDITEQKKLQQQLMQADRLAAVGSVVSGIAHEVNNPLAGALGRADLVLRGNLDDALKKDIEVIRSEMWRAALTVRQLLTFVREHKPEKVSVSINETLEATLALRQYELTAANVQVVKDFQPDLPTILADRNQLQQVFFNIILNAEQAMSTAHGRGTLSVKTRQMGRTIVVTIANDGPGISQEHLPRVFDPFFTTKPVGQGTGLGLTVSYGIVQMHGGTISAASEMGKGATFTVALPVAKEEQPGN